MVHLLRMNVRLKVNNLIDLIVDGLIKGSV